MSTNAWNLPHVVWTDWLQSLIGDKLGDGVAREVYVSQIDPTLVIKLELTRTSFQNITEWKVWQDLKGTTEAKFLAPVTWISDSGSVLMMKRTTPMPPGKEPKLLPKWMSDFKRANFGMLGNKVVCHDYGTDVKLYQHGYLSKKLQKVAWWD